MHRIWNIPICHELCWACAWTWDRGGGNLTDLKVWSWFI